MKATDIARALLVRSVEPWLGPWKGNAMWGQRNTPRTFPPTEGFILGISENSEIPGPPRSIGVTLFRNSLPVENSPNNADVKALITYGSGGASNTFQMDWALGGSFALQANTFRLDAISFRPRLNSVNTLAFPYDPGPIPGGGPIGQTILGFTMGINGSAPPLPPTFTTPGFYLNADGGPTQYTAPVPPFARRVFVQLEVQDPSGSGTLPPPVSADYVIRLDSVSAPTVFPLTDDIRIHGLYLPAGVQSVTLLQTNLALVGSTLVSFLFQLGF